MKLTKDNLQLFLIERNFKMSPKEFNRLITEIEARFNDSLPEATMPSEKGVWGLDINWNLFYHESDISNVMKAEDCLYIASDSLEMLQFILKNKPQSNDNNQINNSEQLALEHKAMKLALTNMLNAFGVQLEMDKLIEAFNKQSNDKEETKP
jgi:hypothetical protein